MDIVDYEYNVINGQAYTEDHVVVNNILVYNIVEWTTEVQVLHFFKQFGEVLKVRLVMDLKRQSKIAFVNFADSKVAAKVLRNNNYRINCCRINLLACYSWQQPGAQLAVTIWHKKYSLRSNIKSVQQNVSILNLNDDCLERIYKHLRMREQINFARTCQRFSDVFIMFSKLEYKSLYLNLLRSLTLWQIRDFLKMTGPQIESLYGEVPFEQSHRIMEFLGTYCTNTKSIGIVDCMDSDSLIKLLEKMSLCSKLSIKRSKINNNFIKRVTECLPKLKVLNLEYIMKLVTGEHICELRDLEELSLVNLCFLNSHDFKEICQNLTNLHTLDIRFCSAINTAELKEIVLHLNKLESFKFSCHSNYQYECIAKLPKLKRLEIISEEIYESIRYTFFVDLVKYQSKRLEELIIVSHSTINLNVASLIGELTKLKKLSCASSFGLNDECLEIFAQTLNELEKINLKNCGAITDTGLLNLLKNCHKLNRLNIIRCKSLTDNFVFDALKLLQQQQDMFEMQRKVPLLILANLTNINTFVADSLEVKSSDLMKITFDKPFRNYDFFDDIDYYEWY